MRERYDHNKDLIDLALDMLIWACIIIILSILIAYFTPITTLIYTDTIK